LVFLHLPRTGGTAVQHRLDSLLADDEVTRIELPPDFLGRLDELRSRRVVLGHFYYPVVRLVGDAEIATVVRDPVDRSISTWEYLQWRTSHPDHKLLVAREIRSLDRFLEDPELAEHVRDNQTRLLGAEYEVEAIAASLEAGDIDLTEARRRAAEAEEAPADAAMLARAKRRLERMSVVGVTQELANFVDRLERTLDLPPGPPPKPDNATPPATVALRESAYGAEIRDRLAELNRLDAELYAFACRISERSEPPVALSERPGM
jgi:hypothetical protein